MSKGLEALKLLVDFIKGFELGNVDKLFVDGSYDIIEKELKELEERREMMKRFNEACVPMILDNETEKKLKALEIIKKWHIYLDIDHKNNAYLMCITCNGETWCVAIPKEEYDLLKEILK